MKTILIALTEEQQAVVNHVSKAPPGQIVILLGEAGSGKTQTVAAFPAATGKRVTYIAPTHQAKTVLFDRLVQSGIKSPHVITVASFLNKRPDHSNLPSEDDLLALNFVGGDADSINKNDIIVSDESSMLCLADLNEIHRASLAGVLVIVGDFAQLKPVNEATIFPQLICGKENHPDKITIFELGQNLRAGTQELVSYLNRVRNLGDFPTDNLPTDGSVRHIDNTEQFDQEWLDALATHGQEKVLRLAYTNDRVNASAAIGRNKLGYSGRFYGEGEVLRVNAPFQFITWTDARELAGYGATRDEIKEVLNRHTLQTGNQFRITATEKESTISFPWVPGIEVPVQKTKGIILSGNCAGTSFEYDAVEIDALKKGDSTPANLLLLGARRAAEAASTKNFSKVDAATEQAIRREMACFPNSNGSYWHGKLFYSVREQIKEVSSSLCLTTHKAQGTGCDYVFVDAKNMTGSEAASLKYTAASRVRKQLVVRV